MSTSLKQGQDLSTYRPRTSSAVLHRTLWQPEERWLKILINFGFNPTWGILILASLAGTRSASSEPFHCTNKIVIIGTLCSSVWTNLQLFRIIILEMRKSNDNMSNKVFEPVQTLMRKYSSPGSLVAPMIFSAVKPLANPFGLEY